MKLKKLFRWCCWCESEDDLYPDQENVHDLAKMKKKGTKNRKGKKNPEILTEGIDAESLPEQMIDAKSNSMFNPVPEKMQLIFSLVCEYLTLNDMKFLRRASSLFKCTLDQNSHFSGNRERILSKTRHRLAVGSGNLNETKIFATDNIHIPIIPGTPQPNQCAGPFTEPVNLKLEDTHLVEDCFSDSSISSRDELAILPVRNVSASHQIGSPCNYDALMNQTFQFQYVQKLLRLNPQISARFVIDRDALSRINIFKHQDVPQLKRAILAISQPGRRDDFRIQQPIPTTDFVESKRKQPTLTATGHLVKFLTPSKGNLIDLKIVLDGVNEMELPRTVEGLAQFESLEILNKKFEIRDQLAYFKHETNPDSMGFLMPNTRLIDPQILHQLPTMTEEYDDQFENLAEPSHQEVRGTCQCVTLLAGPTILGEENTELPELPLKAETSEILRPLILSPSWHDGLEWDFTENEEDGILEINYADPIELPNMTKLNLASCSIINMRLERISQMPKSDVLNDSTPVEIPVERDKQKSHIRKSNPGPSLIPKLLKSSRFLPALQPELHPTHNIQIGSAPSYIQELDRIKSRVSVPAALVAESPYTSIGSTEVTRRYTKTLSSRDLVERKVGPDCFAKTEWALEAQRSKPRIVTSAEDTIKRVLNDDSRIFTTRSSSTCFGLEKSFCGLNLRDEFRVPKTKYRSNGRRVSPLIVEKTKPIPYNNLRQIATNFEDHGCSPASSVGQFSARRNNPDPRLRGRRSPSSLLIKKTPPEPLAALNLHTPGYLEKLESDDWKTNVTGFRAILNIAEDNPESLLGDLRRINLAGLQQLTNLRSQVCRAACCFFKQMFAIYGQAMEHNIDMFVIKLLDKSVDTNKFIRKDATAALEAMVEYLPVKRTFKALKDGAGHRNAAVRTITAKMVTLIVAKLGPKRALSELAEQILPILAGFLQEGSLETRMYAKDALTQLVGQPNLESLLQVHTSPEILRRIGKYITEAKKNNVRSQSNLTLSRISKISQP